MATYSETDRRRSENVRAASSALALLLLGAGALLIIWAMMSPANEASLAARPAAGQTAMLLLFMATFSALALDLVGRLAAVAIGALASIVIGLLFQFYSPVDAVRYVGGKADTLVLLSGVGVVAGLLEEGGFFERVAARILRSSGTNTRQVMVRLCVVTYVLSMFMNNLATILVMIPLSLHIAKAMKMDAVGLILGEVIASNLGGASTMVGDFPNILLATEVGLPFHKFLVYMAPICALQLGLLLMYLSPRFRTEADPSARPRDLEQELGAATSGDASVLFRGQVIMLAMIAGFLLCGSLGVSPAVVAAAAAIAAFSFGKVGWSRLVRKMCLRDVLFFASLFVMVGAVSATGVLDGFGATLAGLWQRSPVWGALATAWSAALLTCVLNAGPTTALLIPVLFAAVMPPVEAAWWALSLGVCAGSSATLTGATAGPVAAGILERHGHSLSFNRFARTGLPIMLLFLVVSSCYLVVLLSW